MSTVLQAAMQLPVVTILASGITIDFTADGLTIQGGKNIPETPGPPCQDGLGGGICAQVSSLGSLGVALSRVTLTRNLANSSGGGLAAVAYPNEMGSSLNLTVTSAPTPSSWPRTTYISAPALRASTRAPAPEPRQPTSRATPDPPARAATWRRRVRAVGSEGGTPHPARTHRQPRKTSQAAISTPTTTSRVDDTPRWGAPTSTRPCEITAWWVPSSSYSTLTKIG